MIEQILKRQIVVFSPLYPPSIGGLQNHAAQFNHHLAARGWLITVFTPRLSRETPIKEEETLGIQVIRFPAWEIIPNYPVPKLWQRQFWHQWQQLPHDQSTIVISRTRFFLTSFLALVFAGWRRLPRVHIEHGSDYIHLSKWWQNLIGRLYDHTLGYLAIHTAQAVVANSAMTATFVTKLDPQAKPRIIYRGVDSETIATVPPDNSVRHHVGEKTIVIGYIGRLIAGKGVANLLLALAQPPLRQTHLLIIGDGPEKLNLQQLAQKVGLASRVHFQGGLSHSAAISFLKSCEIVVNPSYTEGLPTAVIEAALCHKAIVATDVGGTREIITHGVSGYLVPPGQPDKLAAALVELVSHPERRQQFGEQAWQVSHKKFQWSASIPQYERLFQPLIKSHVATP